MASRRDRRMTPRDFDRPPPVSDPEEIKRRQERWREMVQNNIARLEAQLASNSTPPDERHRITLRLAAIGRAQAREQAFEAGEHPAASNGGGSPPRHLVS